MATTDKRRERHPVWRVECDQLSWASGDSTAQSFAFPINGVIQEFTAVLNDNTGNKTVTVAIRDEDNYSLYTSGALAENATTVTKLTADTQVYVPDGCNVLVTPSGDPGASGLTVDLVFYGS